MGDDFCLGCEFFFVWGVVGDEVFIDVVGLYGLLFVVVVVKLDLCEIFEILVFCDVFWWDMIVIVDNWYWSCVFVV